MKERPILFSDEMIRRIIDGSKSQTRRVVKPQPLRMSQPDAEGYCLADYSDDASRMFDHEHLSCPYGKSRDRLWLREAHRVDFDGGSGRQLDDGRYHRESDYRLVYKADGECRPIRWEGYESESDPYIRLLGRDESWRSPIHMPRWASRITLEITGVRVERLQEISEADAKAEGSPLCSRKFYHATWFRGIWDSINADRGFPWESNPWVWVIEFRCLT